MKTKFFPALLLIVFYFISCKKDHDDPAFAATRQKLLGKWNNTTAEYITHSYGSIFTSNDTSRNGEYYNFSDDGQLSIYDSFNGLNTKPFHLENDSVILAGSGYDTISYKIRILTDTSLRLYSIYSISPHTSYEYTRNFKK